MPGILFRRAITPLCSRFLVSAMAPYGSPLGRTISCQFWALNRLTRDYRDSRGPTRPAFQSILIGRKPVRLTFWPLEGELDILVPVCFWGPCLKIDLEILEVFTLDGKAQALPLHRLLRFAPNNTGGYVLDGTGRARGRGTERLDGRSTWARVEVLCTELTALKAEKRRHNGEQR